MNFALVLFTLLVITGLVTLADRLWLAKSRAADAREPWWVEYPKSFFPVILIVFTLRSFLVEPFKIPSGSMIPTLIEGDFILVNKFTYGIRIPIINRKVVEIGQPKRGDVMVFRYPMDPSLDYIKRVVGLPGDKIAYKDKRLYINGVEASRTALPDYLHRQRISYSRHYREKTGELEHAILIDEDKPSGIDADMVPQFPFRQNCIYNNDGVACTVPPGHYFMMGDNRDNSADSRFWGFVPEQNIVGRAFFIWFNFDDLKRFGGFR
jgi:signal peptidase I